MKTCPKSTAGPAQDCIIHRKAEVKNKPNRKKKTITHPRSVVLKLQMGGAMASSLAIRGDELIFLNGMGQRVYPAKGTISNQYQRPKSPKVLSEAPLDMARPLRYSPDYAVLSYQTIIAVDSNSRHLFGQEVSAAAVIFGKLNSEALPNPMLDVFPGPVIEFRNVKGHPDLVAWREALKGIANNPNFNPAGKLALIVDSHLGDHAKIQAREIPIAGDFFLPEWASIFYASDAATDGLVNKMLRMADKAATALLDELGRGVELPQQSMGSDIDYEYVHVWAPPGPSASDYFTQP